MQRQTATLDCPKSMIGRVIGKNGETVKALQVFTGASIQIDQVLEPARIIASGTPQALQLATSMVSDIINGTFRGFSLLRQLAHTDNRQPGQPPLASQMVYAPGYGLIPLTEHDAAATRISKVADHQGAVGHSALQGGWPSAGQTGAPAAAVAPVYQPGMALPQGVAYAPGVGLVAPVQGQYQAAPVSGLQQGVPGGMQMQYVAPAAGVMPGGTAPGATYLMQVPAQQQPQQQQQLYFQPANQAPNRTNHNPHLAPQGLDMAAAAGQGGFAQFGGLAASQGGFAAPASTNGFQTVPAAGFAANSSNYYLSVSAMAQPQLGQYGTAMGPAAAGVPAGALAGAGAGNRMPSADGNSQAMFDSLGQPGAPVYFMTSGAM